eukprot:953762_1
MPKKFNRFDATRRALEDAYWLPAGALRGCNLQRMTDGDMAAVAARCGRKVPKSYKVKRQLKKILKQQKKGNSPAKHGSPNHGRKGNRSSSKKAAKQRGTPVPQIDKSFRSSHMITAEDILVAGDSSSQDDSSCSDFDEAEIDLLTGPRDESGKKYGSKLDDSKKDAKIPKPLKSDEATMKKLHQAQTPSANESMYGRGFLMLSKLGWDASDPRGLGRDRSGIATPTVARLKFGKQGLSADGEGSKNVGSRKKYRKVKKFSRIRLKKAYVPPPDAHLLWKPNIKNTWDPTNVSSSDDADWGASKSNAGWSETGKLDSGTPGVGSGNPETCLPAITEPVTPEPVKKPEWAWGAESSSTEYEMVSDGSESDSSVENNILSDSDLFIDKSSDESVSKEKSLTPDVPIADESNVLAESNTPNGVGVAKSEIVEPQPDQNISQNLRDIDALESQLKSPIVLDNKTSESHTESTLEVENVSDSGDTLTVNSDVKTETQIDQRCAILEESHATTLPVTETHQVLSIKSTGDSNNLVGVSDDPLCETSSRKTSEVDVSNITIPTHLLVSVPSELETKMVSDVSAFEHESKSVDGQSKSIEVGMDSLFIGASDKSVLSPTTVSNLKSRGIHTDSKSSLPKPKPAVSESSCGRLKGKTEATPEIPDKTVKQQLIPKETKEIPRDNYVLHDRFGLPKRLTGGPQDARRVGRQDAAIPTVVPVCRNFASICVPKLSKKTFFGIPWPYDSPQGRRHERRSRSQKSARTADKPASSTSKKFPNQQSNRSTDRTRVCFDQSTKSNSKTSTDEPKKSSFRANTDQPTVFNADVRSIQSKDSSTNVRGDPSAKQN